MSILLLSCSMDDDSKITTVEVETTHNKLADDKECAGCGKTDIERYHAPKCPIVYDDSSEEERHAVKVSCTECWYEADYGTNFPTHGDTMYEEI